jgi:preprotein translocase subunit SecG
MTALYYAFIVVFILIAALLCLVILVQESKSMGLGAAFGGDSGDSLFGTSTADVLKKITAYLAGAFMILCVVLSIWTSKLGRIKESIPNINIEEVVR